MEDFHEQMEIPEERALKSHSSYAMAEWLALHGGCTAKIFPLTGFWGTIGAV